MSERDVLLDCLRRLNGSGLNYALTGSMASNFWGIPRTTHDLDFVLQLPPRDVDRMVAVFGDRYFIDAESVRKAYRPPWQFNAIDQASSFKVDFWLTQTDPFDRELFARRTRQRILGETAWLASPEDVILHKLFWHRLTPSERQLADAAGVRVVQGDKLDVAYLRRWADALEVRPILEDLLAGRIAPKQT